jgi:hypothetical protein
MKNLIVVLSTIVVVLSASSLIVETKSTKVVDCAYGQCGAIKTNGKQCLNCCQRGSYYCYTHR